MTDARSETARVAGAQRAAPRSEPAIPELPLEVRRGLPGREPAALEAFFDHYFDRVHRYVRRMVREEHLAEDLTQDVFLHVHRSLESYDPTRPLSPWVYTIATNKVRDLWRSRRHQEDRRQRSVDDDDDGREVPSTVDAPPAELARDETASEVARAVEDLPDMLRTTFVLRYYEGLTFEAIGAMVDRNETAVRKRYSRALGELREALTGLIEP